MANSFIENPHMEDTGWVTLNNTYPLRYRAKRGMVTVQFRLVGGPVPPANTVLGVLPERYRPSVQMVCTTHNLRGAFLVNDNGEISLSDQTAISGLTFNAYMGATITYPYDD